MTLLFIFCSCTVDVEHPWYRTMKLFYCLPKQDNQNTINKYYIYWIKHTQYVQKYVLTSYWLE